VSSSTRIEEAPLFRDSRSFHPAQDRKSAPAKHWSPRRTGEWSCEGKIPVPERWSDPKPAMASAHALDLRWPLGHYRLRKSSQKKYSRVYRSTPMPTKASKLDQVLDQRELTSEILRYEKLPRIIERHCHLWVHGTRGRFLYLVATHPVNLHPTSHFNAFAGVCRGKRCMAFSTELLQTRARQCARIHGHGSVFISFPGHLWTD